MTTTTETLIPAGTLEVIQKASSLGTVLTAVAKQRTVSLDRTVHVPRPVKMTDEQIKAVRRFPATIEHAVTPTERRALSTDEIISLLDERDDLDQIESVIKARKAAQKTAVWNHIDVTLENTPGFDAEATEIKDGFYVTAGQVIPEGRDKGFVRQLRGGSPVLTADGLKAQVGEHGDDFIHADYLACTTEVRVLDEAKVMLHLRKKPAIVTAIAAAAIPAEPTCAHTVGKGKS